MSSYNFLAVKGLMSIRYGCGDGNPLWLDFVVEGGAYER